MFDFFFKRNKKADKVNKAELAQQAEQERLAAQHIAKQDSKQKKIEKARALVMAQIEQAGNDEAALAEIIFTCDFADGRLQAVQAIQSEVQLTRVLAAVRNIDNRVAKLAQSRLDALSLSSKQLAQAQALLEQAQQLAAASPLTAHQLIELEKARAQIGNFPADLQAQFDAATYVISSRLLAQTSLQRTALGLIARLVNVPDGDMAAADQLQNDFNAVLADKEAAALPKALAAEFATKLAHIRSLRAVVAQAAPLAAEPQALDDNAQQASTESEPTAEVALDGTGAAKPTSKHIDKKSSIDLPKIVSALQSMEAALEQGSVLAAQAIDRELRGVDIRTVGLTNQQKERLLRVRGELNHLLGWAKWGGSISRDELIIAVEELPKKELSVNELAKKVGGLRERWKSLEASSGPAHKELWERFDAACSVAYAPAAAHFKQLAEDRQANLEKAELLLSEMRLNVENLLQTADWKAIAQAVQQQRQSWRENGHVDRKHKARLDAEFDALNALLSTPLDQRRQAALAEREELILQVQAISPEQRNSVDQLRALQARWQEQAQALPLRRKDEQALWERFRAACDALFSQRRAASEELGAQRKANLTAKEALCAKLEHAVLNSESMLNKLLQEVASEWRAIGYVDRDVEADIEKRYQNAIAVCKQSVHALREQKANESKERVLKKWQLLTTLEASLEANQNDDQDAQAKLRTAWDALPSGNAKLDGALNARFDAGYKALTTNDQAYLASMTANAAGLDEKLLQLEIASGIDSPAEFAQSRLQAQVAVLRNSLKSGGTQEVGEQLRQLVAKPVVLNDQQRARLQKMVTVAVG